MNISGAEMKIARRIALECQVGSRIKKLHQRIKYKKSKRKVAGVPRVAEAECDVNVLNVANIPFSRGDVSSFARRDVGRA